MTKETSSSYTPLGIFYRHPRLMQGLSWLGGLGLLSSGLVVAQTEPSSDTAVAPTAPAAPAPVNSAPAPAAAPAPAPRPAAPEPIVVPAAPVRRVAPAPARRAAPEAVAPVRRAAPEVAAPVRRVAPTPEVAAPVRPPAPPAAAKPEAPAPQVSTPAPAIVAPQRPQLAAPNLSIPDASTIVKPPKVILNPSQIQESAKNPAEPTNNYIDRTDYSIGATTRYEGPERVVLTERSTGCSTVLPNGQFSGRGCGVAASRPGTANLAANVGRAGRILPNSQAVFQAPQLQGVPRLPMPPVASVGPIQLAPLRAGANAITAVRPTRSSGGNSAFLRKATPFPFAQRVTNHSSLPGQTPTGLSYYNLATRPVGRPKISDQSFMFPLTIPASITSLFGWRLHPITGEYRFHAGTDLGAPQGTPVVAAASGQVATADYLGGYGLTVVLEHEEGTQASLYAHLSEIFVQPGDVVEQGSVIGRVGSTGNSTGPHLHFEWRHLTADGWVAVDAKAHLEYSLAQLVNALQFAQATPQRGL